MGFFDKKNEHKTCHYCTYLEQRGDSPYQCGHPKNGRRLVQLSDTCRRWEDVSTK